MLRAPYSLFVIPRSAHEPTRPNPLLPASAVGVSDFRFDSIDANALRLVLLASRLEASIRRRPVLPIRAERSEVSPVAQQQPCLHVLDIAVRSRGRSDS